MRLFKHYIPWNIIFLFIGEGLVIWMTSFMVHITRQYSVNLFSPESFFIETLLIHLLTITVFYTGSLYDPEHFTKVSELFIRITFCFLIIAFIVVPIYFLFSKLPFNRQAFALTFLILFPLITFFRLIYRLLARVTKEKVLILGAGDIAGKICSEIRVANANFIVQGLIAENDVAYFPTKNGSAEILGTIKNLKHIIQENKPNIMVVALSERRGKFPYKEILDCKLQGIQIEDWPSFYEKLTGKISVHNLRPSWIIFSDGFVRNDLTRLFKRFIDLLFSVIGLCITLPLMVCITLLSKLDSKGPVFFKQERVGKGGKIFTLIKFRTMVADAEKDTGPVWAEEDDPRITKLGKLLRRTGMDEIPQMFNVLKGDMSFVGPRPERPHFVQELQDQIPYYAQRLVVKPGITGWAQVRYGYCSSLEDTIEKLQYDLYYIKNMSFFLDVLIILRTIHKVLFAKVALQAPKPPAAIDSLASASEKAHYSV